MIARPGIITNWDVIEEQVIYYRTHLDCFIEDAFAPIKLTPTQRVIARAIGNNNTSAVIASRGYGKTWLLSIIGLALGVLYPGSNVLVVAPTAHQATLAGGKLRDLANQNTNLANEIAATNARTYVQISKDSSRCSLKNGSSFESTAIESCRGKRAKMVLADEARDIDMDTLQAVVMPTRNETRYNCRAYGFQDFPSKLVYISSACPKSLKFYEEFEKIVQRMATGEPGYFACILDYHTPIKEGLTPASFFEEERKNLPESTFQMEYESKFLGSASDSVFPYNLVASCRTLDNVEMFQPKNSKSRYVMAIDIAISTAKGSDNTAIVVEKFSEKSDGSFAKKLVYIRTYNGEPLDVQANEVRKLFHRHFPNIEKIIFDARGVGAPLDRFLDTEWVDPETGKEYPPLVLDEGEIVNADALRILHPFKAVNDLNRRIYENLRVALEKKTLELPIQSQRIKDAQSKIDNEANRMPKEEFAIYLESDALQIEMGNIVGKPGQNGNVLYDVPKATMHKDRCSALAMCNDYISELEKENIRRRRHGDPVIGIVSDLGTWKGVRRF